MVTVEDLIGPGGIVWGLGKEEGQGETVPAPCHPGLATSLPAWVGWCPSAVVHRFLEPPCVTRRANTSMFIEQTERASFFFLPPFTKDTDLFLKLEGRSAEIQL